MGLQKPAVSGHHLALILTKTGIKMNGVNPLLFLLLFLSPGSQSEKTVRKLAVLKGQSITIPCFYHSCDTCTKQLCKAEREVNCPVGVKTASMPVIDDPAQGVFAVSMRNLQKKDSGMYLCLLDRNGHFLLSVNRYEIIVTDTPGVSVKDNMVEAELGESVTVNCSYNESYRNSEKKWCSSKNDSSCITTSQHRVTLEVDSALGLFSVTVGDLERKDTGWYWCSVGDTRIPVHIRVTPRRQTTAAPINPTSLTEKRAPTALATDVPSVSTVFASESSESEDKGRKTKSHSVLLTLPSSCGILLVLGVVLIVTRKLCQKYKQNKSATREATDTTQLNPDGAMEVTNSTVVAECRGSQNEQIEQQLSQEPGDAVTYSSLVFRPLTRDLQKCASPVAGDSQ